MNRLELAQRGKPLALSSLLVTALGEESRELARGDYLNFCLSIGAKVKRVLSGLARLRPGAGRARAVHKMIDAEIRKWDAGFLDRTAKISCGRGCSHCCHMFVTATDDEVALLLEVKEARGLEVDRERLRLQQGRDEDDYMRISYDEAACVFLSPDGDCLVYEDRPSACRNLRVFTPPKNCAPSLSETATVRAALVLPAEILSSAAMNLPSGDGDKVASLATKLWRHFEHEASSGHHVEVETGARPPRPGGRGRGAP